MGIAALPPRERATLVAGRLIREGLLQQSALSPVDASCDVTRAAALADAVLLVAERCLQLARSGVPPAAIEDQDFSPVLRAREEAGTPEAVTATAREVLARLGQLERPGENKETA